MYRKIKNIIKHKIISKIYNYLFSNVLSGVIEFKVDNIEGLFEVDARSHLLKHILLKKKYEPQIVELIKSYTPNNKDAINVGANIGLYTILLSSLIGEKNKVLAVEPTVQAYEHLNRNLKKNNIVNVIPFRGIATDREGKYKINVVPGKEEYSSIGEICHPAAKHFNYQTYEISGYMIDTLVERYKIVPGILFIDVEGAEYKVLLGAEKTIKKYKPIIISEINNNLLLKQDSSSAEIFNFLTNMEYSLYNMALKPIEHLKAGNILGLHKESKLYGQ